MSDERMNARERWGLLLIDELTDRPPVYPLITSHAATVHGCNLIDYCRDGRVLAEAQIEAQRIYGQDGLTVFTDVGLIAEAFGSRYLLRAEDVPILLEPLIQNPEQVDDLAIPEPQSAGRLPVYIEAVDRLFTAAGDRQPVFAFIPAPFTTAAGLRGTETFLTDTILMPETAHKILDLTLNAALKLCDECILAGGLPVLVDPLASGSVISRHTFKEFALPYIKGLIDYLHRYDLDIMLHICGETKNILDLIPATDADLFSLDKLDLAAACKEIGSRVRLVGNIPPNSLLAFSGHPTFGPVEEALTIGMQNPKGFVLSTGCEVPIRADKEKLLTMINTAKRARYVEW
ncbi:MAG: hypothetical protein FJY65_04030 [Calditrichaeota bacterium]|nr:hypothetical protein [Calditrichota bacterium]